MKIGKIILLSLFLLWSVHPAFGQSITLVTLGDSLTEGDGDDGIGGGYPTRLLSMLQDLYPGSTLNNVGISGDTSDDLINKQLEPAVNLLNAAPAGNLKIALVWIGSNDLFGLYNWVCDDEYANDYSACEGATFGYYSDNINNILTSLKTTGSQIYIALLDDQSKRPVMTDPTLRVDNFPQITDVDVSRMSTQVSIYNDEITRLSSANGATTVDFFNTTIFENWASLSDDGNHPNGAGYDLIATIWYQAVSGASKPVAPILTVTSAGTSVTLAWSTVSGATAYTLSYAPYPYTGSETIKSVDMGGQTSISVNLWEGAAFYVAVQAYNTVGRSGYSNIGFFSVQE
jgi:lysophospholipase L1-like esterase